MDGQLDEKIVSASMDIIMNAGDGRLHITEAFDALCGQDYQAAKEKINLAQTKLTAAHRVQTEMIQQEADGKSIGYSVLFSHAQDTLMTINSELVMAKRLIKVFESLENRLSALEEKRKD